MTIPSFNVLAIIVAGSIVAVAVLLLQSRIVAALISAYASLLITETWGAALFGLLTGGRSIFGFSLSLHIEPYVVTAGLFLVLWVLFIMLLSFGRKPRLPVTHVVLLAIATAGFVLSTLVALMTDAERVAITGNSAVATWLANNHALMVLIPVVVLLFTGLQQRENYR